MQNAIYLEINIFCIVLILLILEKVIFAKNKQNDYLLFIRVMICEILVFVFDGSWIFNEVFCEGIPIDIRIRLNVAFNFLYFIFIDTGAFYTFIYSETLQKSRVVEGRRNKMICTIPLIIYHVIAIMTIKTGWLFYVDSNNIYHRGPLYLVQVVVGVGYLSAAAISAIIGFLDKNKYIDRTRNLTLSMLVLFPIVGGIMQAVIQGIPILNALITFALINLFINLQDDMISIDPLTQMNNRNQMIRVLSSTIKNWNGSKKLYLMILDVDSFKQVNDHYGHVKGDELLKFIGETLKNVASKENCFTARYGGDEFIMLCEVNDVSEIKHICNLINCMLSENNSLDFPLSVSIGYEEYREEMETIPDFIAAADQKLYKMKREKKRYDSSLLW